MDEHVSVAVEGHVATVRLNRPEVHNAFNESVIESLTQAFTDVGQQSAVRMVVLSATGKSFCAGADLHWMQKMVDYSIQQNVEDAETLARMLHTIRHLPKPVVARVHGTAMGGGVGLVAACDLAVAVQSATFALSEVRLGILPAVISPYVLEKIGPGAARRYFLTAERFDAAEARRIGLVSEVVANESEMDAFIQKLGETFRTNAPEAVAHSKALVQDVLDFDWKRATKLTAERIAERRVAPEGQEGMHAFLEKRKPTWTS